MIYMFTSIMAFLVTASLAAYFILESAQAASQQVGTGRRDVFAAVSLAIIATMLTAMAILLLNPTLHGAPALPDWFKREWL